MKKRLLALSLLTACAASGQALTARVFNSGFREAHDTYNGITWPVGYFFRYCVRSKKMANLGPSAGAGESGKGPAYRVLCRSIAVDPESGCAYFTNPEGDIFRCRPDADRFEKLEGEDMRKDYFGKYDPADSGSMGYNWRQTVWHPAEKDFYGVHGNSGYLFRFDPRAPRIEVLERLTSEPSRRRASDLRELHRGHAGRHGLHARPRNGERPPAHRPRAAQNQAIEVQ